jgi:nucleoid-associated protein YgaU
MKKNVIIAVLAIGCLAIGAAGGFFVSNSKNKTVLAAIQADVQKEQTKTQETLRGYNIMIDNLNGQLQMAKLELDTYKSGAAPAAASTDTTAPAQNTLESATTPVSTSSSQPATRKPTARQSTTTSSTVQYEAADGPPAGTKQYTVQNGDSLWTIAQKQLGNGSRFKEILKLNPKLTAKSNLVVGSRINLPAQ